MFNLSFNCHKSPWVENNIFLFDGKRKFIVFIIVTYTSIFKMKRAKNACGGKRSSFITYGASFVRNSLDVTNALRVFSASL